MTEIEKTVEECIAQDKRDEWGHDVDAAINLPEGENRSYALAIIGEISKLILAIGNGKTMEEAVAMVEPGTTLIQMGQIAQGVVVYSAKGEAFRKWWNEWHDRVPPPAEDKQRVIFNPSRISYNGKPMLLIGLFDPKMPLTKNPQYGALVKTAIAAAKGVQGARP